MPFMLAPHIWDSNSEWERVCPAPKLSLHHMGKVACRHHNINPFKAISIPCDHRQVTFGKVIPSTSLRSVLLLAGIQHYPAPVK
jgi:hypothetical protein